VRGNRYFRFHDIFCPLPVPPGQTVVVEKSVVKIRRYLTSASRTFHHAEREDPLTIAVIIIRLLSSLPSKRAALISTRRWGLARPSPLRVHLFYTNSVARSLCDGNTRLGNHHLTLGEGSGSSQLRRYVRPVARRSPLAKVFAYVSGTNLSGVLEAHSR
jgi:hypothetical protein